VIVRGPRRDDLVMQLPSGGLHHLGSEHRVIGKSLLGQ
jgi:hypothetical protein